MGLFSFGPPKEKRTQLFFRDDGKFQFRKLELEDTFLVEKNKDDVVQKGWKHFYRNQFPFEGYKGIPADMVTMSFARDVLLDPYDLVETRDKPDKGKGLVSEVISWLVEVGTMRRLKMIAKRGKISTYDKIVLFLGAAFMCQVLIIGLMVLAKRGG